MTSRDVAVRRLPILQHRHQQLTYVLCMQRISRALQIVFFSVAVLFFLRAGGVENELCNKVCWLSPL